MIVGRTRELDALTGHFTEMLAGRGRVLFITGEAGLGKTTLVHEWWARVGDRAATGESAGQPQPLFLECACSCPIGNLDVGGLEALQPWADLIASLQRDPEAAGDPAPNTNPPRRRLNLKRLVRDAAPEWVRAVPFVGEVARAAMETAALVKKQRATSARVDIRALIRDAAPAWAWALPAVGEVAYAAIETSRAIRAERGAARAANQEQVFQQYVNVLVRLAESRPLVVCLDDLHWADASSIALLRYLADQLVAHRILVLATYRRDDALTANAGAGHPVLPLHEHLLATGAGLTLELGRLDAAAITALLGERFPGYARDARFEEWLLRISGGNALFVTQYLRTLEEDGLLNARGVCRADLERIAVPRTALAVVEERTRRLDPEMRRVLTYATAEGEEFTSYVLAHLADREAETLVRELTAVEATGMVRSKGASRLYANQTTAIFGFSHALFHKALYEALSAAERDVLHRECFGILKAEWDRVGDTDARTPALAAKLVTHAEKSAAWREAASIAIAAAHMLWRTFAETETMEMIARALDAMDRHADPDACAAQRAEAMTLRANVHTQRGRYEAAREDCRIAVALFTACAQPERVLDVRNTDAWVLHQQSQFLDAIAVAEETLRASRALHYAAGAARALSNLGAARLSRAEYDQALALYTECRELRAATGDRAGETGTLINLGNVLLGLARYPEATDAFQRALAINEELGNLGGQGACHTGMAIVAIMRGDYARALHENERSLVLHRQVGDRAGEAAALANIGAAYGQMDDSANALAYFERCLPIKEAIGDLQGVATTLANMAIVASKRGDHAQSKALCLRSLAIHESTGGRRGIVIALGILGPAQWRTGDFDAGRATLDRALTVARKLHLRAQEAVVLCERGLLEEGAAKRAHVPVPDAALADLHDGIAIMDAIGYPDRAQFETELARIERERHVRESRT